MKQKTLKEEFTLQSVGLHTGLQITATFHPAPVNTGICLRRVDLPKKPCHQALADYVSGTERGTVLERGKWKISTVEHALSALYAMGVDNCIIDVDAPEMPILDGIRSVLEETPPELAADIFTKGILMTGGGALLSGFDELIRRTTGVEAVVADEPQYCVARGSISILNRMSKEKKTAYASGR